MRGTPPSEIPDLGNDVEQPLPDFIERMPEPKSFDDTQLDQEIKRANRKMASEFKEEAGEENRASEGPLKPHHFKVGEVDLDQYPTDTSGLRTKGEGPLTHGEMESLDRAGDDREKIRKIRKKLFH